MKSILILFVIFIITFEVFALPQGGPNDVHQLMEQMIGKCLVEVGIDQSMATAEKMQSDDREVKCFHACMSKETKIMNNDGTINKEALFTFPPDMPEDLKQHLKRIHTPCLDLKGDDECETAFLLFKCMKAKQESAQ